MADNVAFIFADASRLLRKRFDLAARGRGATGAQWRVLLTLSRNPGINQAALADILDVEPITTCRMVDRLEQAELVERRRDPRDRRAWQVFLTDKALPVIEELRALGDMVVREAMVDLSAEEIETLSDLLSRIRGAASTPPQSEGQPSKISGTAHG